MVSVVRLSWGPIGGESSGGGDFIGEGRGGPTESGRRRERERERDVGEQGCFPFGFEYRWIVTPSYVTTSAASSGT